MRSLRIVHGAGHTTNERLIRGSPWRWVYSRGPNECELPPLGIGVQALQLSPYRAGVARPQHTRLLPALAFQPCACPRALSGLGQAGTAESSALNSGPLWEQFAPCATRRTVSAHPAPLTQPPASSPFARAQTALVHAGRPGRAHLRLGGGDDETFSLSGAPNAPRRGAYAGASGTAQISTRAPRSLSTPGGRDDPAGRGLPTLYPAAEAGANHGSAGAWPLPPRC
jgi:hypothetical protein